MSPVDADLARSLLRREPIFDRSEIIWDEDSFDAEVAADFYEIGASGQVYSRQHVRDVVLARLSGRAPASLADGYRIVDAEVRLLVHDLAQVSYTLEAEGRVTRRSTLYRRVADHWQALFHQGTVVSQVVRGDLDGTS